MKRSFLGQFMYIGFVVLSILLMLCIAAGLTVLLIYLFSLARGIV